MSIVSRCCVERKMPEDMIAGTMENDSQGWCLSEAFAVFSLCAASRSPRSGRLLDVLPRGADGMEKFSRFNVQVISCGV